MDEINKNQRYLDVMIDNNYPTEKNDRFDYKVCWLLTEISEFANDDAWFKYCRDIKESDYRYKRKLEEASDCLHLFTSLAHELDFMLLEPGPIIEGTYETELSKTIKYKSLSYRNILNLISKIELSNKREDNAMLLVRAFAYYTRLTYACGLEWEDVKKEYLIKNSKNVRNIISKWL